MYNPNRLKYSITASSLSDVESGIVGLKSKLRPNDEIKIMLKGSRVLEMITALPELLRRHDYGLIWAEEDLNNMTIIAYARYKAISSSRMRLKEKLRKHGHAH